MKTKALYTWVNNIFKHNCYMNKRLVSASYFKDGDSGVVFSMGKEYRCEVCNRKWSE